MILSCKIEAYTNTEKFLQLTKQVRIQHWRIARCMMTVHAVMLRVPSPLYEQLKRRAEQTQRTVEAELLDVVATAMSVDDDLPATLAEAISSLALLGDEALWRAARSRLSAETASQMEDLHLKRQREGLTEAEEETLNGLVRQYERTMLVRAQAATLLKERGYDISQLLAQT
jgi:phage terminase Nu1 subunit (DNA packaging protein)